MWLNTALNQQLSTEIPHVATVTAVGNGTISTLSHALCIDVPVVSSLSIQAIPQVGDEVVILPTSDGKYYCIGQVVTDINEDEVMISSPSGACIKLLSDGRISLNGLIISKGGILDGN